MNEIRLYKNDKTIKGVSFIIGAKAPATWELDQVLVTFPASQAKPVIIKDGDYMKNDGMTPVSAVEVVEALLSEPGNISIPIKGGRGGRKPVYGKKWFIDYDEALLPLFKKYNLAVPEDGKSYSEIYAGKVYKNLEQQGIIIKGLGEKPVSEGQKALEEAKLKQANDEIDKLKKQLESLKAQNDEVQSKIEDKPKAKVTKKKEAKA